MDFFINLGIFGIALILLGKLALNSNESTQEFSNFKFLDKLMRYMDSELLARINLKYGKYMLITGILGVLFYKALGLLMVFLMVLITSFYLVNLFISGYKFYINTR